MQRDRLIDHLDTLLAVRDFDDYGPQGLQVEGRAKVNKIVLGVSASAELFRRAVDLGADMVIVHHGILWNRERMVVKGLYKERLKLLLENDISLLAYHLPLDKHPELGNNAVAAAALHLQELDDFAQVGIQGICPPISPAELIKQVKNLYQSEATVFAFGPESIRRIAICSGGAARDLSLAIDLGLDAYITGEAGEPSLHLAKEGKIHFIAAGHYATERLGIKSLGDYLRSQFELESEFIDLPNPI
ncbi:MAG TPA: Nif3-like dinuclear metal center hexameric protein [bacterium]|jgi:dinuclear metal center YbgI/SA1388 family protein|nr:Nif3-like dinuclear metal center hexameric protein [bacterium]HNT64316.1 Nif3-like dinuclear metal center hexameric protein [bacterium]HOX85306.1 Nif3-like dinuclear metal center hexameric protein [bacterium]HPG44465.1 Nif3-like dinuclear metal center hexameric protein [bacterium]HPM97023.1 Nif3-like dinuclear metal center hexameric protein [bacterium]